jgi:preprotein translocase subunit SecG
MGVIFGGGSSSLFGSSGAGGLLAKITAIGACIFMVTSLSYNSMSSGKVHRESSIMDAPAPVAPAKPQGIVIDEKPQSKSDAPAGQNAPAAQSAAAQPSAGQGAPDKSAAAPSAPAAQPAAPAAAAPAAPAADPKPAQ